MFLRKSRSSLSKSFGFSSMPTAGRVAMVRSGSNISVSSSQVFVQTCWGDSRIRHNGCRVDKGEPQALKCKAHGRHLGTFAVVSAMNCIFGQFPSLAVVSAVVSSFMQCRHDAGKTEKFLRLNNYCKCAEKTNRLQGGKNDREPAAPPGPTMEGNDNKSINIGMLKKCTLSALCVGFFLVARQAAPL